MYILVSVFLDEVNNYFYIYIVMKNLSLKQTHFMKYASETVDSVLWAEELVQDTCTLNIPISVK